MTAPARFDLVDIVASDYDASVEFYRRVGAPVDDGPSGEIRHAHIEFDGVEIHIDNEHLAGLYNSSWRSGRRSRIVLGFRLSTREAVDERYGDLTAAGHEGVQPPYDTFWGARYAIVADPDGTHIGLMSPTDKSLAYWPPNPAPAIAYNVT
jgi:uncharacterized glyoxalase superfamily protein PhnB